ncbi:MAG: metal-sensitive transcriptional regulator [Anaerolineales bacterium]|nr:metal-sensitive transcriptional regulator [Anaerolineales bacterium]
MAEKEEVLRRARVAVGHLEGVSKMIERDEYCINVIRQIQAVQAALNRLSSRILENHLQSCVTTAVRGGDPDAREKVLKEIAEVFQAANRS